MNYPNKEKILNILILMCLIALFLQIILKTNEFISEKREKTELQYAAGNQREEISKIRINSPTAYSYKTKREIYEIRKQYVKESPFSYDSYEPSEMVFGQIEDKKPWISTYLCKSKGAPSKVDGDSEESRFMNNPSILVSIDFPFIFYDTTDSNRCNFLLMPLEADYNSTKKELTVKYSSLLPTNNSTLYQLKGLNALDFGYKYVYLDKSQSANIVKFTESENVTNSITEFQDFIHVGGSCNVEGGCNNGSPWQPKLDFKYDNSDKDVVLYFKLWKNMPSHPKQTPDMTEKLIIFHK